MYARAAAFVVWALAAATAVFWGLRLFASAPAGPAHADVVAAATPLQGDLTRLLGADPPPPPSAPADEAPPPEVQMQLLGVVSPRAAGARPTAEGAPPASSSREGVALIAVDGAPARAYRVGNEVHSGTVLQSVAHNRALLGPRGGAASIVLELSPPAPAATGTLPPPAGFRGAMPAGFAPPPARAPAAVPPQVARFPGGPAMYQGGAYAGQQPAQAYPGVKTAPGVLPTIEAAEEAQAADPNPLR
jgi:general secretion pathway protein C